MFLGTVPPPPPPRLTYTEDPGPYRVICVCVRPEKDAFFCGVVTETDTQLRCSQLQEQVQHISMLCKLCINIDGKTNIQGNYNFLESYIKHVYKYKTVYESDSI